MRKYNSDSQIFFVLLFLLVVTTSFAQNNKTLPVDSAGESRVDSAGQPEARVAKSHSDSIQSPDRGVRLGKSIRCIFQDRSGNFWFGSDGDGIYRYDGKSFVCLTEKDGLCNNQIRTIQEDKSGNLWFGTGNGICRYDGTTFTLITDTSVARDSSFDNSLQDRHESLWFGARDGAYHYDGRTLTFLPLPLDSVDIELRRDRPGSNVTAYAVYSILEDTKGNLWFGTEQRGVCRYDGKAFNWFREQGLDRAVRTIFEDKIGNIWFGNNGGGVYRYDGLTMINFSEEHGLSNPDFLTTVQDTPGTLARVWTITEDKDGNLWFGTIDAGAWRYDGRKLTNFTTKDGLGSDRISTIFKDSLGILWFGTYGGGVYTYDGKSSFHEFR